MRKIYLCLVIVLLEVAISSASDILKTFFISTDSKENSNLEFVVRIPEGYTRESPDAAPCRIFVLFGGRNWKGEDTIARYGFSDLADRYQLFLVSPSFKDDDYWYPEKWSGKALLQAVEKIKTDYLAGRDAELYYYGYSAGGQCANLFYFWNPGMVSAWGAHACGVWPQDNGHLKPKDEGIIFAPCIVTCGIKDEARYHLSLKFVQEARRNGIDVVWKSFQSGHELNRNELDLAHAFFESVLLNAGKEIKFIGDDQLLRFYPAGTRATEDIEIEDRSVFFDKRTAELWNSPIKD